MTTENSEQDANALVFEQGKISMRFSGWEDSDRLLFNNPFLRIIEDWEWDKDNDHAPEQVEIDEGKMSAKSIHVDWSDGVPTLAIESFSDRSEICVAVDLTPDLARQLATMLIETADILERAE